MRKFTLLTIACIAIALASTAQINKGAVLLGGNISGSSNKQTVSNSDVAYKQTNLFLSPSVGFVTAQNQVWGVTINAGVNQSKANNQSGQTQLNNIGGSIYHRRYLTLGKGFYFFGQLDAGYNYGKQKYTSPNATEIRTSRTDHVFVSAAPGITYAVFKNFHLEAGLNQLAYFSYSAQNETQISNGVSTSSKGRGLSFSTNFSNHNPFSLGFRFVL